LISLREVDPEVISVRLRRVVPHAEVTVIGIVDVYFARGTTGATGTGRRNSCRRSNPVRVAVHDRGIIVVRQHAKPDGMLQRFRGFVGACEVKQMIITPFSTG